MHEGDQILAIDGQVGVNNTPPPLRRGELRGAMITRPPWISKIYGFLGASRTKWVLRRPSPWKKKCKPLGQIPVRP